MTRSAHFIRKMGLLLLVSGGCDPVLDAQIAALGPEQAGVPRGPTHRPGQPCLVCHRDGGEADRFTVAGTIYRDPSAKLAVQDAEVLLVDAARRHYTVKTNCVGNFYVASRQFEPVLPLWTSVRLGSITTDMESPVQRSGDCAACHVDPLGPGSAGHVFLTEDVAVVPTVPEASCD